MMLMLCSITMLVKDYLFMTVINAEENKNDLTTMPHTIIGDLAIVYKVMIKTTDERFCAAKVTNQLMVCLWNRCK